MDRLIGWRRLAEKVVRPQLTPFTISNRGVRFEGNLKSFIDRQIYLYGGYEELLLSKFLGIIPGSRRDVALDVGANIGTHALRFAQHFRQVHAFEPNPEVFAQLSRNASLNDLPLVPHQIGLADREALLDFHLTEHDNLGLGTFAKDEQYDVPLKVIGQARVVKADEFLVGKFTGRIDAVKIDTQGYEPEALRGMRELLREHRPYIWFEVGGSTVDRMGRRDQLESLIPYGFRLLRFEKRRKGFVRTVQLAPVHSRMIDRGNLVAVPD